MSKLSLSVHLNVYSDSHPSNSPSLNNFKWNRAMTSLNGSNALSQALKLAPEESNTVFNNLVGLDSDSTTEYDISLKPLTSNTYRIAWIGGTAPNFRDPRSLGIDATTQIEVTTNGPTAVFTSPAGTPLNTTALQVGDYVRVGSLFSVLNQGEFRVIAKTSTSFTIESNEAINEGPITLGAGYASQLFAYSGSGVQKGQTLVIKSGFSPATYGSYKITDVTSEYIEFYHSSALPDESGIINPDMDIYESSKQLLYIESTQKLAVTINGDSACQIEPFIVNNSSSPGIFLLKSTVYSLNIVNKGTAIANVFIASVDRCDI